MSNLMPSKYHQYCITHIPQSVEEQWGKCVEFSQKLMDAFPDDNLERVEGYVYSPTNPDNPKFGKPKKYTHVWLRLPDGQIVDPSINQFQRMGKITYQEFEGKFTGYCIICADPAYDGSHTCNDPECINDPEVQEYVETMKALKERAERR